MKHMELMAILALACLFAQSCAGEVSSPLRFEILLNQHSADKAGMGALQDGLDITPGKFVLVGDQAHLYAIGWGGIQQVDGISGLSAFSYTPDGLLMGIQGQELMYVDESGSLQKIFSLPDPNMTIAPGYKDKMFLMERATGADNALYELLHGKKLFKLLTSPEPISAVAETQDGKILFSAGNALYSFTPDKKLQVLAVAPGKSEITSFAIDPDSGRIYLSDGESIYAMADGQSTLITNEMGGMLHWLDGGLIVFNAKKSLLMRIVGI